MEHGGHRNASRSARFGLCLMVLVGLLGCRTEPDLSTEEALRQEARSRLSQLEGTVKLDGLTRPVEVLRDEWGVAHIYAETVDDLFFAQGFVAAQDRLYQMEIWRRTGAGELAEVFGEDFIERDRIARLVRYRGDLDAEWSSYSPDAKSIATAFTNGINAYVRHRGDNLPIEFELLDFEPGEWEAEDCILRIAGLMMVRNARQEVARAEMVAGLGLEATRRYFPPDPPRRLSPDPALELAGLDQRILEQYRAATSIPYLAPEGGSNNWVVDGTLSATGKPLLASDPHRAVVLPSLRYLIHLVGPGWNVIGSGEPALPGVAIGHNEHAGWGFTIVQYDAADLFVEHVDPENPVRYRAGDDWLEMEVERELVRVRGREEPVEVELKLTRHGPVIWEDPDNPRVVALRWAGQEPGTAGYLGSLALDRVEDWKGFVRAMESWKVPSENLVYADVSGDIGWIPAGLLPIRENWSGLFPVPGFTGKYEWNGFRSVDELPRIHNPEQHYVATANHNIRPEGYEHDLGFDWSPPYRFRRIDEVLSSGQKFTIEDFQRLQHDQTSLPARDLIAQLRALRRGEGSTEFQAARLLLEDWDQVVAKDSAAAALFEIWLPRLKWSFAAAQGTPEERKLIDENLPLPVLIDLLAAEPPPERRRLFVESLEGAWNEATRLLGAEPSEWRWGDLHTITFEHPLGNTDARGAVFNRGPVSRGGDGYTPNATPGADFRQTNGASYRHVLDVGDWDRSVFTSTPGQSGQPESPFYDNLLELWANHKYAPLVFSRAAVEENTAYRLVLEPQ